MSAAPKKSYFDLAKEAIVALKERTGSSPQAIKAHIVANHPSIKFAQHLLRAALNKGAETGKFVKVKASFKLGAEEKKVKKVAAPKVAKVAKVAAPKVAKVAKVAAKKAAPKKGKKNIPHKKRIFRTVSPLHQSPSPDTCPDLLSQLPPPRRLLPPR